MVMGRSRQSATTGHWRSGHDFPRRIVLDDRFSATTLNPALAQFGQVRPIVLFPYLLF